jgi:signal transduction histidine kinase
MKERISYRSTLVFKAVSLITLGFALVSVVVWLFFRNEVRDIGYYLRFGKRDEIALLVTDYLGDPPSRFKARILAQTFDLTIVYREEGAIRWAVERWRLFERRGLKKFDSRRMADTMMDIMKDMHMMRGERAPMIRQPNIQRVILSGDRTITLGFPPPFMRRRPGAPLFFFLSIAVLIGLMLILFLRRTFSPLDHVIEASERIGTGDLSFRIDYDKGDDFGKVAAAFNTMASRLSTMLSGQRELLHFISHELRTPLTRIRLALELKDEERAHEIIGSEVREIDSLVEAVSELSRLDSIDRETAREPVDVAPLLADIVGAAGENRVRYEKPSHPLVVSGNEILLKKALGNLVENALKYTDGQEPVEVTLGSKGGYCEVNVKNGGTGIPSQEQDRIWEPFFRGSNAVHGKTEGRGLGLVVVKRVVELLRGQVAVCSSPAGPTVFRVRLPLANS